MKPRTEWNEGDDLFVGLRFSCNEAGDEIGKLNGGIEIIASP